MRQVIKRIKCYVISYEYTNSAALTTSVPTTKNLVVYVNQISSHQAKIP